MGHTFSFPVPAESRLAVSPMPQVNGWLRKLGLRRAEPAVKSAPEPAFARDLKPFDLLQRTVVPGMLERGERSLRIGVTGDTTGREAFALAMTACEHFPALAAMDLKIVAVDLPEAPRSLAERGVYRGLEKDRGLPLRLLLKYFERKGDHWQVGSRLRAMVEFQSAHGEQPMHLMVDRSSLTHPILPRLAA